MKRWKVTFSDGFKTQVSAATFEKARTAARIQNHSGIQSIVMVTNPRKDRAMAKKAYTKKRAKNPQTTKPAHRFRGFGVVRVQPGTKGRVQFMVRPYDTWSSREFDAMSFGLQSSALFAAKKCGHVCAVVPLGAGHTEAVREFIGAVTGK